MNKNLFVVACVAAVVALGVLVARQSRQIAVLKAAQAEERQAMEKKTQSLAKAARAARAESKREKAAAVEQPVEAAAARRPAQAPAAPAEPSSAQPPAMGTNFMGAIADMMKNPQMKEMMKAQQKVVVDQMYAALPRYLNLPADVKEKLDKLLLERQLAMADVGLEMMSGSAEERQKAIEASKTVKAECDQAIKELLGDQDYETFKQYEQSVPEQTSVAMFKNSLTGDDALTEQQEHELVAAMYQARKELPQDSLLNQQNQSPDPSQFSQERIDEAIKQMEALRQSYAEGAQAILSAAQLERFKQWQQQMASMQQVGLRMAAQMFGQGKAGGAAK